MSRARDLAAGTFSGDLLVNGSGTYLAGIESTTAYSFLALKDSNSSGSISDPNVGVGAQTNDLLFRAGGSEKARILSSGGITFNGDTAAANALSDYEEGSFSPNWNTAGSSTDGNNGNFGYYTKVGNLVYINISFSKSSTSSLTGPSIGQVPFTPSQYTTLSVFPLTGFESINDMLCAQLNTSGYVELYTSTASSGNNYGDINSGNLNEGGTVNIRIAGCYHTNS